MGCGSTSGSSLNWFEEDGILYGTAAAGTSWAPCGSCYELEIMPDCASIHGGYGCDINRNRAILGSGRQAFIVALNLCPECNEGHFDFCMAGNWGGTVLGGQGGIDNPALKYRGVGCPPALMNKLDCGSDSQLKAGPDPSGGGSGNGLFSTSTDTGSVLRNLVIFILGLLTILFLCCVARATDQARKQAQGVKGVAHVFGHGLGIEHSGRNMIAVNLHNELQNPVAESVATVKATGDAIIHPVNTAHAAGEDIHFVVTGHT